MLCQFRQSAGARNGPADGLRGRGTPAPVTGVGRRGELRLAVQGRRWRTRYRAPLFVNVLPSAGGTLLALPVDQGGGLRTGERHLQRVALADGAEVTWAPPASISSSALRRTTCFSVSPPSVFRRS